MKKDLKDITKVDLYLNGYSVFKSDYEKYIRGQITVTELPEEGIHGFIYWTILQYADIMDKATSTAAMIDSLSEHMEEFHFDEWIEHEDFECEFTKEINDSMEYLGKAEGYLYKHMDKLAAILIELFIRLLEKPELYKEFFTDAIAKKANELIDTGFFKEILEETLVDYQDFLDETGDVGLAILLGLRIAIEEN